MAPARRSATRLRCRDWCVAFGTQTRDKQFRALGSVKSNIGHAESAAGIAGLTKVALQLAHRTLVPSLHAAKVNPYLKLGSTPFFVQRTTEPWTADRANSSARRAALSSFGASGSNAHVVLEEVAEATRETPPKAGARPAIVPISAKSDERLRIVANILRGSARCARVAPRRGCIYAPGSGRVAMEARAAWVVTTLPELAEKLEAFATGASPADTWHTVES